MALRAQKVGRASRTFAQLWQVPTFLLGLTAFALVAATAPLRHESANPGFATDIAFLRTCITKKNCDTGTEALAESLLTRATKSPERLGEIHFLAGSMFQELADTVSDHKQLELRHKASIHLERALSTGVPIADMGTLYFRLGRLLHQTNGDLKRAADLLTKAITAGYNSPLQAYALLTQIQVRLNNVDGALAANQKHLDAIDKKHELDQALLLRGRLWLKKDNRLEALKALDRVSSRAADDVRIAARLLQAKCCEEENLWPRAVEHWRELLQTAEKVPGGRNLILYSLGLARANSTPTQIAEARKAWLEVADASGPESQAALIRLGEHALRSAEPDVASALDHFAKSLRLVQSATDYQNALIDINAARGIFEAGCRTLEQAKQHALLEDLAETYRKIANAGVAEEWLARGLEGRAKVAAETAAKTTGPEAELAVREARTAYQKAGEGYDQAARARAVGTRSDVLWRAAECYLAAKEVVPATVALGRFVQEEKSEARLAEGWLLLAETYAALGKRPEALSAYYKCIEFPATPFAFRARYELALEEIAAGRVDQAHDILKQNLQPGGAAADRPTHEKSLFKLAELLYDQGELEKACIYLKEAIEVYPTNAAALRARDQLGSCYRRFATAAADKWKKQPEDLHHKRARDGWLEQAYVVYEKLAEELAQKSGESDLTAEQTHLLIHARIFIGHVLLERGDLEEALQRYHDAFQKHRYFGRLAAIQGIHAVWKQSAQAPQLKQRAQDLLRTSAELALIDVERMQDTEPPFNGKDQTRAGWSAWLRSLRDPLPPRVNVPPAKQPAP